jgi:hypothetical protein
MPCHVEPTAEEERQSWERHFRHNSPTAEAFCELLRLIEAKYPSLKIPQKAPAWWKEHKARDADKDKRDASDEKAARTRAAALKKLTPAERKALGVDTAR